MALAPSEEVNAVKGINPQALVEKIIRLRIYESIYWKEQCFALTAETLIDKVVALKCVGGIYGNQKPTEFLCLLLKLLQLQPEHEIILEYLNNEDFKYLRLLAAFYIRFTANSVDVYRYLEPLLQDFRKIRVRDSSGAYVLSYVDVFIDELLNEERVCDLILPRLTKRDVLEDNEELQPRRSLLDSELEEE